MASTNARERISATPPAARAHVSLAGATAIGLGLALGIFLFYFLAYPIRHLILPVGFDPPWYVWRAEHFTALGVGSGELAARPGYPVLSAILGSLTGLSQMETTVVLSLVLVSLLALAVGAFARSGLGFDRWRWVVVVATSGVLLGPTHLVGENLSNALNITLEIAALVPLAAFVGGKRGLAAAAVLLVAGGLAHWDFVALFAVVMGGVFLRAPFRTIEIGNDQLLFRRKFRTDVARLLVPGVAGLVGPRVLPLFRRERKTRAFGQRVLQAWTYVMAAGMVVGLLTFSLPPARFLAHLVALPGAITVGATVAALAAWLRRQLSATGRAARRRLPALASLVVTVIALGALSIPGLLRWYRYPVLLEPAALQQARTADGYVRTLAPHQPVIFLVDYRGRPGSLSAVLKERTIRMGLSPARQLDAHIFVGALPDLLRGNRTAAPDERAERFTRRYWDDVRPLLASEAPVVILRAMAQAGYRDAVAMGARVVAPGVAVLKGPTPGLHVPAAPPPNEVPSLPAGIAYGLAILVLLWLAGAGWTRVLLGPGHAAETLATMAPVMGAAMLMLAGLAPAELGIRLGAIGGGAIYLVVSVSGTAAAMVDTRRPRASRPRPAPTD